MLTFLVGSKQAFEVSLADVAQTQLQGKTDVYMEFHVDDTTGATEVIIYTCRKFMIFKESFILELVDDNSIFCSYCCKLKFV